MGLVMFFPVFVSVEKLGLVSDLAPSDLLPFVLTVGHRILHSPLQDEKC